MKIQCCSICDDKIFKLWKRKPNFFEKMAGISPIEQKDFQDWLYFDDDQYVCQNCYEQILQDYGGENEKSSEISKFNNN